MKKINPRYDFPKEFDDLIPDPETLVKVIIERNGCMYIWGVPHKYFKSDVRYMQDPLKEDDLLALGGKLIRILVLKKYSINFKQNIGVRNLKVYINSSESEDKQLLHKFTSEFRKESISLDRETILGTTKHDE